LSLAVVRDLREARGPAGPDELAAFEALLAAFGTRLGAGYATATPDNLQRRFLDSSGTISLSGDQGLSASTAVPTHPSSARPASRSTPPSPGGTADPPVISTTPGVGYRITG
jgi:hypothetical protein